MFFPEKVSIVLNGDDVGYDNIHEQVNVLLVLRTKPIIRIFRGYPLHISGGHCG